jgi:Elongation factor TS
VRCSSDGLARSGEFVDYVNRLCLHVLEWAPKSVEELARQDWSYEGGTVAQAQQRFAERVGESVCVKRLAHFQNPEGRVWSWMHPDSRKGVMLSLRTAAPEARLKEVAFQLAGQILVERAGELVIGECGPEEIFDAGQLNGAPWRRDPERSVGEALTHTLGEGSRLLAYARFDVG